MRRVSGVGKGFSSLRTFVKGKLRKLSISTYSIISSGHQFLQNFTTIVCRAVWTFKTEHEDEDEEEKEEDEEPAQVSPLAFLFSNRVRSRHSVWLFHNRSATAVLKCEKKWISYKTHVLAKHESSIEMIGMKFSSKYVRLWFRIAWSLMESRQCVKLMMTRGNGSSSFQKILSILQFRSPCRRLPREHSPLCLITPQSEKRESVWNEEMKRRESVRIDIAHGKRYCPSQYTSHVYCDGQHLFPCAMKRRTVPNQAHHLTAGNPSGWATRVPSQRAETGRIHDENRTEERCK